jgi:hypothetical protein
MDGSIRASGPGPKGRRRHQRSANACVPHAPSDRPRHDLGGTDLDRIGRARRPVPVAMQKIVSPSFIAGAGRTAPAIPSRATVATRFACFLVSFAFGGDHADCRVLATQQLAVGVPCGQRGDPFVTLVVPEPADAVGDDHRGDGRLADAGARDSDAARGALGRVARLGDRRARAGTNAADRPSRSPERTSPEGPLSPQGSTSPGTTSHPAGRAKP